MKQIIFILIILFIAFSCKKDNPEQAEDISGQWEWIKTLTVYPSEPVTPENSGTHELLIFKTNHEWLWSVNETNIDSGTYTIGRGTYTPYLGAHVFIYDSVVFFKQSPSEILWDYYDIHGDTLQFCPGYAGKLWAYSSFIFPDGFNGSKFWKKK